MREAFRGGWPFGHPPNLDFELNRRSPQATGLVFWMPLGINQSTGTRHVDRMRGLRLSENNSPGWALDGERGFSLLFDNATSESITGSGVAVAGPPFTMTCWYQTDDTVNHQTLMSIAWDGATNDWHAMRLQGGVVDSLQGVSRTATGPAEANAQSAIKFTANVWQFGVFVERATNDRAVYINAGSKGTNTTDIVLANTLNKTSIGVTGRSSDFNYMSGMISDARIYSRALSDAEVFEHYRNPWELIMPRVRFWPGFADGCVTTVTVTETATVTVVAQV